MKHFDYTLPDECRAELRGLFPNLHEGKFINLVWESSRALIQYDQSKDYHSKYYEKPSEHIRQLKVFVKHAKALKAWAEKDSDLHDSVFFGCDFLDSVDNDEPVRVSLANTRTALNSILYNSLNCADNAIEAINDMAKEPRITPAFFRRELIGCLVSGYQHAFGYLPSVYWDESRGSDCSEDCIQGEFIDLVGIILEEAGDMIGRHSIYSECKRIIAERNKPINEQDWKHLL